MANIKFQSKLTAVSDEKCKYACIGSGTAYHFFHSKSIFINYEKFDLNQSKQDHLLRNWLERGNQSSCWQWHHYWSLPYSWIFSENHVNSIFVQGMQLEIFRKTSRKEYLAVWTRKIKVLGFQDLRIRLIIPLKMNKFSKSRKRRSIKNILWLKNVCQKQDTWVLEGTSVFLKPEDTLLYFIERNY